MEVRKFFCKNSNCSKKTFAEQSCNEIFRYRLRPSAYKDVEEIGIDDWAWRKGLSYGTIVIDLRRKRPIDLLGNRAESGFRS